MSRSTIFKTLAIAIALLGVTSVSPAKAQDGGDALHWPYNPPQVPANGHEYKSLYDGFYTYPREQRIVPQIQGPLYRNFYGGKRVFGFRHPAGGPHGLNKMKYYSGYHFTLDVF